MGEDGGWAATCGGRGWPRGRGWLAKAVLPGTITTHLSGGSASVWRLRLGDVRAIIPAMMNGTSEPSPRGSQDPLGLATLFGHQRYRVIRYLAEVPEREVAAANVVRVTRMPKTTVHEVLDQLARAGLLEKIRLGRTIHCTITDGGTRFFRGIAEAENPALSMPFRAPGTEMTDEQWRQAGDRLRQHSAPRFTGETWTDDELSPPASRLQWEGREVQ